MGLGYLTLAVTSEQDKYLIGNPQFTFFKGVYKKHTNFAIDYQYIQFIGDTENALGKGIYIDIPKNGDLLHRMYLEIDVSADDITKVTPSAYSLIDHIDLIIGGQRIDRHYGTWLAIWHELHESIDTSSTLSQMTSIQPVHPGTSNMTRKIFVPLHFWFNNNIGLALPLIALQYNDIKFQIQFNTLENTQYYSHIPTESTYSKSDSKFKIQNVKLLCEFIHLDTVERRLFTSGTHEYLITQVQSNMNNNLANNNKTQSIPLRFNYPIKEILWTVQNEQSYVRHTVVRNDVTNDRIHRFKNKGIFDFNYWKEFHTGIDQLAETNLSINGNNIFEEMPAEFFKSVQQYQSHSGYGISHNDNNSLIKKEYIDYKESGTGIYSYSFALHPEEFQPSGSLNFSKLEQAQLKFKLNQFEPTRVLKNVIVVTPKDILAHFDQVIIDPDSTKPFHYLLETFDKTKTDKFDDDIAGSINSGPSLNNIKPADGRKVLFIANPEYTDVLNHKDMTGIYTVTKREGGHTQGYYLKYDYDLNGVEKKEVITYPIKVVSNDDNDNIEYIIHRMSKGTHENRFTYAESEFSDKSAEYTSTISTAAVSAGSYDNYEAVAVSPNPKNMNIYGINYNILKINSGMSSILFTS